MAQTRTGEPGVFPAGGERGTHREPASAVGWVGLVSIALAAVVADQVTKAIARHSVGLHGNVDVLPFLSLTRTHNTGIAFSLVANRQAIVAVLTFAAVGWMLVHFARAGGRHVAYPAAFGLLIGGAVGNLYDRLANGYVTDFIHIAGWPVFNLADTFITLGVGILMLILLRSERAPVAAR